MELYFTSRGEGEIGFRRTTMMSRVVPGKCFSTSASQCSASLGSLPPHTSGRSLSFIEISKMRSRMAVVANCDQFKKQLAENVLVSKMVDLRCRCLSAPLTKSVRAVENQRAPLAPFVG